VGTRSSEASRPSNANFGLLSALRKLQQGTEAAAAGGLPLVIASVAIDRNLRRLGGARDALDGGIASTSAPSVMLGRGTCFLPELRRRRGDVFRGGALAGVTGAIATTGFTSLGRGRRGDEGRGDAGLAISIVEAMLRSGDMVFSAELPCDDAEILRRGEIFLEL